jgi:hypothetical protein
VPHDDERLDLVREMRERGRTPKQIARALGLRPAEAARLVCAAATLAEAEAPEPALVGCWISPSWSAGLGIGDRPDWALDEDPDAGTDGMVTVLVARQHRYGRVSVCGYLADVYCLGVKNALGPEIMSDRRLREFIADYFSAYLGDPIEAPIELAREVVLGSSTPADRTRRAAWSWPTWPPSTTRPPPDGWPARRSSSPDLRNSRPGNRRSVHRTRLARRLGRQLAAAGLLAPFRGQAGQLDPGGQVQLAEDTAQVKRDRVGAQAHPAGDLAVGEPLGH